ncbi:MAG: hypothetical protein ACTSQ4_07280, partial [Candidatus Heimdallarchaeaceae archaeon]
AGYEKAIEIGEKHSLVIPGRNDRKEFDYKKLYQHIIALIKKRTDVDLFEPLEKLELELY